MKSEVQSGLVVCLLLALVAMAALLVIPRALQAPPARRAEAPVSRTSPALVPPAAPYAAARPLPSETPRAARELKDEAFSAAAKLGVEGGTPARLMSGAVGPLPTPAARAQAVPWAVSPAGVYRGPADFHTEAYNPILDNPFLAAFANPLSTFSIDVDTASYANVRRFLAQGQLPPKDAVRVEELLNYFRYDYPSPGARRRSRSRPRSRPAPGSPSTGSCSSACAGARSRTRRCPRAG